ncbi:hypothetical protein H8693_09720 [Christensenellaceae bacterium NSJ-63]|uniref:Uncharacterized protein n=1 Tax=Guopingia tenuis TaxID=2763656 RepID=A0A926DL39_9FIRM|nr:DUF6809 family protein [Guopingia tenuis]MBC8539204.1 hypothetical protein [Guopingia tenuis]
MNTIKRIYEGEQISPALEYPKNPIYLNTKKEFTAKIKELNSILDQHGIQLLDEILSLRVELDNAMEFENFLSGFKIGATIMMEVLQKD